MNPQLLGNNQDEAAPVAPVVNDVPRKVPRKRPRKFSPPLKRRCDAVAPLRKPNRVYGKPGPKKSACTSCVRLKMKCSLKENLELPCTQ